MTKSHAELQEFICNEQVVNLIEEVLDNVESKLTDVQDEEKIESTEPIASAEVVVLTDENDALNESDLYVDESLSKCMKRQMNESIMSIGDPMFTESRKLKHQQSLLECTDYLNETVSI